MTSTTRLTVGDTVRPRELATIRSTRVTVPAPGALTHLQFRRFAGCPVCNLHLRSVAGRHEEIRAAGIHEIAVFASSVADLLPHQEALPFDVIADPARELYTAFGVERSPRAVLDPRSWPAMLRGTFSGGPGRPRKGESAIGLPADFLIAPDGRIRAVRYARHADDQWSVTELLRLASEVSPLGPE